MRIGHESQAGTSGLAPAGMAAANSAAPQKLDALVCETKLSR